MANYYPSPPLLSILYRIEKTKRLFFRFIWKAVKVDLRGPQMKLDYTEAAANDLIRMRLENGSPLMITRLGVIEMETVIRYLNIQAKGSFGSKTVRYFVQNTGPFWWDDGIRYTMRNNAGYFPLDDQNLSNFAKRFLNDLPMIDILGCSLPGIEVRMQSYFPKAVCIHLRDIEPYYHEDPWSQVLEGKRVLIIHPFETSIQNQYKKRHLLFKDPKTLPIFELLTIKAVQSIAGNPVNFDTWFDALDWMGDQIQKTDFDIAIIGAGAYGLPLAAI